MIQDLLPLLPKRISAIPAPALAVCALAGSVMWLCGSRFSRPLLLLVALFAGAAIGFQSPRWLNSNNLDPWSLAMLGGLILGVAGFIFHRWFAALGLGAITAVWAALAAVACAGWGDQLPDGGLFSIEFLRSYFTPAADAPPDVSRQLFLVAATMGMMGGFTLALIWQRIGLSIFWSMLGLTFLLIPALTSAHGRYAALIPRQAAGQVMTLITLLAMGALAQYKLVASSPEQATPVPKETEALTNANSTKGNSPC